MSFKEYIKVLIRFEEGKTVCICPRDRPKCEEEKDRCNCIPDVVVRDKMDGWHDTMKINKYGK